MGGVYEGKVAKLMDFGAFVTILPGKDGLVHISQISEERVQNVSDKLTEGEIVKVKVLEVDKERKRIALTMRLDDPLPSETGAKPARPGPTSAESNKRKKDFAAAAQNKRQTGTMAALFEQALKNKR